MDLYTEMLVEILAKQKIEIHFRGIFIRKKKAEILVI